METQTQLQKNLIIVNDTEFPLLKVLYPETFTKDDVDALMRRLEPLYQRAKRENKHIGTVADVRAIRVRSVPLDVAKYLLRCIGDLDKRVFGQAICDALVVTDKLLITIVTAQNALRTNRGHQMKCFTTASEGIAWTQEILRSRNK